MSASMALGPDPGAETGRTRILRENVMLAQAEFELQKAFYNEAPSLIDAATAAREKGLAVLEAESELQAHLINETLDAEEIKNAKLLALDAETIAKRMGLAQQFPDFWERQMKDLVSSNAFSLSQITTAWTSGIANSIVNGGDFAKAAWNSTKLAIVQGLLNLGVQWIATNGLMVASTAATAVTTSAIWGAASTTISGYFAVTTASFEAMAATMVTTLTAVGTFVMGVLTAIAEALADTIFGIPYALAILAGVVAIAAALAATGNLGFKEGGIGDFGAGTPATLHGPEAIIPLNNRGAAFMRDVFGGGGGDGKPIVIHNKLIADGRQIAQVTTRHTPSAWRSAGAPA
jgi:hypothetical protein